MGFTYGAFQSGLLRSFGIPQVDHYFDVFERSEESAALSPVDVAAAKPGARNLIVVTATGGGIQASGWVTTALGKLFDAGVDPSDVRVLSTVSGGSVGAGSGRSVVAAGGKGQEESG